MKLSENKKCCDALIQAKNSFGFHAGYYKCDNPAKFNITFREGATGKVVSNNYCGIHKSSTEKWAKRVKKRMNFDAQLKIETINL